MAKFCHTINNIIKHGFGYSNTICFYEYIKHKSFIIFSYKLIVIVIIIINYPFIF